MFQELNKYTNNGHFFFNPGDTLSLVSKDVPKSQGVYYILKLASGKIDLVYIGKSGTITQDGSFKGQSLRGRLNNKHEGVRRQEYFDAKMNAEDITALQIYWFVTFDKANCDLPAYVEGIIMQRYYEVHGKLPPWNKDF